MVIHNMPRGSGKTATIINEIEWCCLFGMLPICMVIYKCNMKTTYEWRMKKKQSLKMK